MEQINDLLPSATSRQSEHAMQKPEKKNSCELASRSDEPKKRPDEAYLAVTMRMVRLTLELANQPPLSAEALDERAAAWAEALFLTVPENRMRDAYDRAVRDHSSTFPINAFEIKIAWDNIAAEDRTAKAAAYDSMDPIDKCSHKKYHDNANGEIVVADPYDHSKDLVVPCPYCRFEANKAALDRHGEKHRRDELPPFELPEIRQIAPPRYRPKSWQTELQVFCDDCRWNEVITYWTHWSEDTVFALIDESHKAKSADCRRAAKDMRVVR